MEKKYIAIALLGEYNCKNFLDKHKGEVHTSNEWETLIDEFKGFDENGVFSKKFEFRTKDEMKAFCEGVQEADNYFSGDYYTVMVLTEGISDSAGYNETTSSNNI